MAKQNWDLEGLSAAELVAVRDDIEEAIDAKVTEERKQVQSRMDELNRIGGGSTRGVARGNRTTARANGRRGNSLKGTRVPPKYRGPNGETWSGRGLAPRWLSELEGKGKKRDDFLV